MLIIYGFSLVGWGQNAFVRSKKPTRGVEGLMEISIDRRVNMVNGKSGAVLDQTGVNTLESKEDQAFRMPQVKKPTIPGKVPPRQYTGSQNPLAVAGEGNRFS